MEGIAEGTEWAICAGREAPAGWRREVVKAGKAAGRLAEDMGLAMTALDYPVHDTTRATRMLKEALGRILYADPARRAVVCFQIDANEVRADVSGASAAPDGGQVERVQVLRRFYAAGIRYNREGDELTMLELRLVH